MGRFLKGAWIDDEPEPEPEQLKKHEIDVDVYRALSFLMDGIVDANKHFTPQVIELQHRSIELQREIKSAVYIMAFIATFLVILLLVTITVLMILKSGGV